MILPGPWLKNKNEREKENEEEEEKEKERKKEKEKDFASEIGCERLTLIRKG